MDKNKTKRAAEVMAAFAEGKRVQNRGGGADSRCAWYDTDNPVWDWACYDYRIAPEAVPLGPGDIPPGTAIRHRDWPAGTWSQIQCVGSSHLRFNTLGCIHEVTLQSLASEGWEILTPGSSTWRPASKMEDAR